MAAMAAAVAVMLLSGCAALPAADVPAPQAADPAGRWQGIIEVNPASDRAHDGAPECRDGRVRVELRIADGRAAGTLTAIGVVGAPGFNRGPVTVAGRVDAAAGTLALGGGPGDHFYNGLEGRLSHGTWWNSACAGHYRLRRI